MGILNIMLLCSMKLSITKPQIKNFYILLIRCTLSCPVVNTDYKIPVTGKYYYKTLPIAGVQIHYITAIL